MMEKIQLSSFNSYFELFVAFTSAYSGLPGFNTFINTLSLKKYEKKNFSYHKRINELKQDYNVISKNSSEMAAFLSRKIPDLEFHLVKIKKVEQIADNIFSGLSFRPMFYLVCSIYIGLIIIGGMQGQLGNITVFITCFVITFYCIIYFIRAKSNLKKCATNEDFNYENIRYSTKKLVGTFFIICIFTIILCWVFSHYVTSCNWLINHCNYRIRTSWINIQVNEIIKSLIILGTISISVIPFYLYYKREKLFFQFLKERFEKEKAEIDKLLADIRDFESLSSKIFKK